MKTRQPHLKKEYIEGYLSQINWDWLFLKGQLIFSGIFLMGLFLFIYWVL